MGVGHRAAPDPLTEQCRPLTHKEVEVCPLPMERSSAGRGSDLIGKPCSAGVGVQGLGAGVGVPGWCPQGEPGVTDSAVLLSSVLELME